MEGYLNKQETTLFGRKIWKKRYAVLKDDTLKYYKGFNLDQNQPFREKGSLELSVCELSTEFDSSYPDNCFLLIQNGKKSYFAATNHDEYFQWLSAITFKMNYDSINQNDNMPAFDPMDDTEVNVNHEHKLPCLLY
jgi:PH domain